MEWAGVLAVVDNGLRRRSHCPTEAPELNPNPAPRGKKRKTQARNEGDPETVSAAIPWSGVRHRKRMGGGRLRRDEFAPRMISHPPFSPQKLLRGIVETGPGHLACAFLLFPRGACTGFNARSRRHHSRPKFDLRVGQCGKGGFVLPPVKARNAVPSGSLFRDASQCAPFLAVLFPP